MPDVLRSLLARVSRRRRLRIIAAAITIGGALLAAILIVAAASGPGISATIGVGASIAASVVAVVFAGSQWRANDRNLAETIEAADGTLDNLIVTAAELAEKRRPVRAEIRESIFQQAAQRAARVDAAAVVPLAQPISVAGAVITGCLVLIGFGMYSGRAPSPATWTANDDATPADMIAVHVTPPAYTRRAAETHINPLQLTVLAGSALRIESDSRVVREWVAHSSEAFELRVADARSRFLAVTVVPDAPPSVHVIEPGRDAAFATPAVTLTIGVETADDLGLVSVALRYTKASGGGENVTFTEGEIPLAIERVSDRQWRARAQWALHDLGLVDGDVVVYRAIARDANPAGSPSESDAFLVEIGRTAEITGAGFALPTEERKYAISQQMVIYKTEQLLQSGDNSLERSRMIGIEQRMVRAEVVFLSGGEVEDEVEEAAHSHELAEGRLENRGRAEMVRAINLMSRAEAQLNDGNPAAALPLERQALASLERALDRRRYFLRTLPDRSRIDMTRRLTGERGEARSWVRDSGRAADAVADQARAVMDDLIAALADGSRIDAVLAARVAAVEAGSPDLQKAAVGIATAPTPEQRRAAVETAMLALTAHALKARAGSWPVALPADPLAGRLADALPSPGRRR